MTRCSVQPLLTLVAITLLFSFHSCALSTKHPLADAITPSERSSRFGPHKREGAAVTYLSGSNEIIVFGGLVREFGWDTGDTWRFSTVSQRWRQEWFAGRSTPARVSHAAFVAVGPKSAILFGGYQHTHWQPVMVSAVWLFSVTSDTNEMSAEGDSIGNSRLLPATWEHVADDPEAQRIGHSVTWVNHTASNENFVISFGGSVYVGTALTPTADIFLVSLSRYRFQRVETISTKRSTPAARSGHTAVYSGGTMLIFGGHNADNLPLNDVWAFHVIEHSWTQLVPYTHSTRGDLLSPRPRAWHHSALLDGSMIVFGGRTPATGDTPPATSYVPDALGPYHNDQAIADGNAWMLLDVDVAGGHCKWERLESVSDDSSSEGNVVDLARLQAYGTAFGMNGILRGDGHSDRLIVFGGHAPSDDAFDADMTVNTAVAPLFHGVLTAAKTPGDGEAVKRLEWKRVHFVSPAVGHDDDAGSKNDSGPHHDSESGHASSERVANHEEQWRSFCYQKAATRSRASSARVFDSFIYLDESEIIGVRLAELEGVVEHHIVVDATLGMSNRPIDPEFQYIRQQGRFTKYKLHHHTVTDMPRRMDWCAAGPDAHCWGSHHRRETHQRNALIQGAVEVGAGELDDDIIIISDADEIPSRTAVMVLSHCEWSNPIQLVMYQWNSIFNIGPHSAVWLAPTVTYVRNMTHGPLTPDFLKRAAADAYPITKVVYDEWPYTAQQLESTMFGGGWHLKDFRDLASIRTKLLHYAHNEVRTEMPIMTDDEIKHCLQHTLGCSVFDLPGRTCVMRTKEHRPFWFPTSVRENLAFYVDWFRPKDFTSLADSLHELGAAPLLDVDDVSLWGPAVPCSVISTGVDAQECVDLQSGTGASSTSEPMMRNTSRVPVSIELPSGWNVSMGVQLFHLDNGKLVMRHHWAPSSQTVETSATTTIVNVTAFVESSPESATRITLLVEHPMGEGMGDRCHCSVDVVVPVTQSHATTSCNIMSGSIVGSGDHDTDVDVTDAATSIDTVDTKSSGQSRNAIVTPGDNNALALCDSTPSSRVDCGFPGISHAECVKKGCCWSAASNGPWCFHRHADAVLDRMCRHRDRLPDAILEALPIAMGNTAFIVASDIPTGVFQSVTSITEVAAAATATGPQQVVYPHPLTDAALGFSIIQPMALTTFGKVFQGEQQGRAALFVDGFLFFELFSEGVSFIPGGALEPGRHRLDIGFITPRECVAFTPKSKSIFVHLAREDFDLDVANVLPWHRVSGLFHRPTRSQNGDGVNDEDLDTFAIPFCTSLPTQPPLVPPLDPAIVELTSFSDFHHWVVDKVAGPVAVVVGNTPLSVWHDMPLQSQLMRMVMSLSRQWRGVTVVDVTAPPVELNIPDPSIFPIRGHDHSDTAHPSATTPSALDGNAQPMIDHIQQVPLFASTFYPRGFFSIVFISPSSVDAHRAWAELEAWWHLITLGGVLVGLQSDVTTFLSDTDPIVSTGSIVNEKRPSRAISDVVESFASCHGGSLVYTDAMLWILTKP